MHAAGRMFQTTHLTSKIATLRNQPKEGDAEMDEADGKPSKQKDLNSIS